MCLYCGKKTKGIQCCSVTCYLKTLKMMQIIYKGLGDRKTIKAEYFNTKEAVK